MDSELLQGTALPGERLRFTLPHTHMQQVKAIPRTNSTHTPTDNLWSFGREVWTLASEDPGHGAGLSFRDGEHEWLKRLSCRPLARLVLNKQREEVTTDVVVLSFRVTTTSLSWPKWSFVACDSSCRPCLNAHISPCSVGST